MFKKLIFSFAAVSFSILIVSCRQEQKIKIPEFEILHLNEDKLTQLIIYDVFSPPVASRIYAYASLASYEAMRHQDRHYPSLTDQLHGFEKLPEPVPGLRYNYTLAATSAFFTVVHKVVFSVDSLKDYETKIYGSFKGRLDDSTYARSMTFGASIGKAIMKRANLDNYPQTRGKSRFLGVDAPGKWRPTPPDYLDGVEYCWGTMHTFCLRSSSQFSLPPPPPYSADSSSPFVKQNKKILEHTRNMSPAQKTIARYWDDNPFVLEHSGHLMFANKKITPGGHWMGITAIACRKSHAGNVKTAQAYALASVAMFDAFVSCWQTKYETNYIRPVTYIHESIDRNWSPYLQTPPFPEYPSGHSTITRAAAVVLSRLFGSAFSFQDTSDLRYIGMQRHFDSFVQAANEASISRFYGGIHYLNSVNKGALQGKEVGEYILATIKLYQ